MSERSYGFRYNEVTDTSAAGIAKLMRAEIKVAVAEGLLPAGPTYSVTSETFSGGCAINLTVRDWPEAWQVCEGHVPGSEKSWPDGGWTARACPNVWCAANNDSPHADAHQVLTVEAQAAKVTLERIHGAYNHNGSDSMTDYFDVRYYGHVEFESAQASQWRAEEKARKQARRQAVDAAAQGEVRRVKVYGSKGKRTVHDAVEVDGHVKLVCGAQLRRSSLLDFAEGQDLTCSRCQKKAERVAA